MNAKQKFEINPEYKKLNNVLKLTLFMSVCMIVLSIVFLSPIFVIVGCFIITAVCFIPKKYLKIENESIIIESRYMISALNDTTIIRIRDIQDAFFVKGRFKSENIFAVVHYSVDYDYQRVFTSDKIVLNIKGDKPQTIYKIGETAQFKDALDVINSLII